MSSSMTPDADILTINILLGERAKIFWKRLRRSTAETKSSADHFTSAAALRSVYNLYFVLVFAIFRKSEAKRNGVCVCDPSGCDVMVSVPCSVDHEITTDGVTRRTWRLADVRRRLLITGIAAVQPPKFNSCTAAARLSSNRFKREKFFGRDRVLRRLRELGLIYKQYFIFSIIIHYLNNIGIANARSRSVYSFEHNTNDHV